MIKLTYCFSYQIEFCLHWQEPDGTYGGDARAAYSKCHSNTLLI